MIDRNGESDRDEARGPEYERLAMLARASRPSAPPDLVDRVMRAVAVSQREQPAPSILERLKRGLALPPLRIAGPLGVMALAALVLIMAAIVYRPAPVRAPAGGPQPELVTHQFELVAPEARKVCLVGDFNQWELCRVPMVKDGQTGKWSIQIPLSPGRHEYMFVVDGESWVTDPRAPVRVDDGFGNMNAVVFL